MTLIDDHTHVSWVYLLKEKLDTEIFIKKKNSILWWKLNFKKKKKDKFRNDNGKKYFNKILGTYFLQKGIIHQSSCFDTPR